MKELTTKEINLVLEKIRTKYDKLTSTYKKPISLKNAFEDRYIFTLKMRRNLTVFLMAEIEAVEEIYKSEEIKHEEQTKAKYAKPEKSFADKVLEQNKIRYSNYTKISLDLNADEEISYLCGATRSFLNDCFPLVSLIFENTNNTSIKLKINKLYNETIEQISYKGDVPIIKHYISAIQSNLAQSKIMFEYQRSIQNIGFLLNSINSLFDTAIKYLEETSTSNTPIKYLLNKSLVKLSNDLSCLKDKNCLEVSIYAHNYLKKLITDFRLKDIKKV